MNKAMLRFLLGILIVASLLAFTLALSPLTSSTSPAAPQATVRSPSATASATPADKSQPGSTTGLVIMSFAITAIIVVPILLQRNLWIS